ncbi:hypothetical protein BC962_0844 [Gillisia mitskevichiae]|uniref:Uncharacterized protein n=1 Tax=Gillisia mitskevichiae TaxID=270921 RepID=A0A495PZC0_9FLAO|nr:TIR domain-containing protein [Gillisia mitskevichiae]RKS55871.1 hypothetical protein BC962_0844 [Gillisia mitskevichiae]
MNLKDVVVFYFDNYENFFANHTQSVIGKALYKDTILIQNKNDFEKEYSKLEMNTSYVLVCHVIHSENEMGLRHMGYKKFQSEGIEDDFNIKANLVSSGDSGVVTHNIYKNEQEQKFVHSYPKIHDNIKNEIIPVNIKGQENINTSKTEDKNSKKGVFLSHSHHDLELVNKFKELVLELGLGLNSKDIMFTSNESFGIPAGTNIPKDLENFLKSEMGLFIQFLTPNYEKSRICLNEEGAAWCLVDDEKYFIPLIVPPHNHKLLSWIKTTDKGIKINNRDSLMNIYVHRKDFFGKKVDETRLLQKTEEFIEYFKIKNT